MHGSAESSALPGWREPLAAAGLDLFAALPVERYDALVPSAWQSSAVLRVARRACVIGSGGRRLFAAYQESAFPQDGGQDPLDRFVRSALDAAVAHLAGAGRRAVALHYHEERAGSFVDLVALGREAGLGWPSRLGLLLHPECGPWISLRGLLLVDLELVPAAPLPGEGPCAGCPAPCAAACPGSAIGVEAERGFSAAAGSFSVARCAAQRGRDPDCALRCAARRACPVGAVSAYSAEAEAHHMRASGAWLGSSAKPDPAPRH